MNALSALFRRLPTWAVLLLLLGPVDLLAQNKGYQITEGTYDKYIDAIISDRSFFPLSNLWVLIAAGLVFMMHLGFATLEAGLTQKKNTVNVLYKNVFVICAGIFLFALTGFRSMLPPETFNKFFHLGFWIDVDPRDYLDLMSSRYTYGQNTWWSEYLYMAMFAAASASIISGAVAERVKLSAFQILVVLLLGFAYPIAGSWTWMQTGWLSVQGFLDSAGGAVVHGFGGFAALACVLILGPRKGRYVDGQIRPVPGHSLPLATAGMFFLWFGWFGFNGGTVGAHPEMLGRVMVNTAMGAATGGLASMLVMQLILKKPDLSMFLNGILGGLVSVTAAGPNFLPTGAAIAGAVGGILVVVSVLLFDRLRVDDPVGAISVHAICGTWGVLALGTPLGIGWAQLPIQALGILTYALAGFGFAFLVFTILKYTIGVRVTEEEEAIGLDVSEHGQEAYGDAFITPTANATPAPAVADAKA